MCEKIYSHSKVSLKIPKTERLISMEKNSKIYIAGHAGLVGSALQRLLQNKGYLNIICKTSKELDLTDNNAVDAFFKKEQPEYIFLAAAKVGGILANNTYPADFIFSNLSIQNNIIHAAYKQGVKKLLFLGSSCIYPKMAPQPIVEDYLLTGFLEPTNEPYAIAKIAGIKMCQAYHKQYGCRFVSVMPTNLYGPGDNYHLQNAHVLPSLIRKLHEAKESNSPEMVVWGTGSPRREFLHVDDCAAACYFIMQEYESPEIVNIGTGTDHSIKEMAEMIQELMGYEGKLVFDTTKPDGTPRKLLNVDKINNLGWEAEISLREGVERTIKDFVGNYESYVLKAK